MTSARGRARAWAELLRISAVFTVPGDALAGAAATRTAPNRGTALAVGASVCLYEAGMALNDWADRDIDAVERPARPLPSGRITPAAALTAASTLTGAGLVCAALAGRRTLVTATALAGTVWAYDLGLKNTPAGPYAMATARSLDLLLGATATHAPSGRQAVAPAALLGAHTLAVTGVSRHETTGGSSKAPLAALATAATIAWAATKAPTRPPATHDPRATNPATAPPASASSNHATPGAAPTAGSGAALAASSLPASSGGQLGSRRPRWASPMARAVAAIGPRPGADPTAVRPRPGPAGVLARRAVAPIVSRAPAAPGGLAARPRRGVPLTPQPAHRLAAALAAAYLATAARPLAHAALNPSPYLLQRAVGGGIRAMIPLQAALVSRAGAGRVGVGLLLLMPVARRLSRKVSPT
ncbi:SCO3242 family prenyltransferase [Streptomyces sp. NPDC059850]|uniref:SCO3242 family prenyltransferase n=1 Tax=Streptomyces sp. NPDC059850 TaxID=3346970 RepID=UPI0036467C5B